MRNRVVGIVALLALPLLALTGCAPGTPPAPPVTSAPPPPPPPSPNPPTLADDVLLHLTAKATASNGAVLNLTLNVHKSTAWNDPAGASRTALMNSVCEGYYDNSVYQTDLWSFGQVDVTAVADPTKPAWPADKRIHVMPYSTYLAIASTGALVEDSEVDGATPHCKRDRMLTSAGQGSIIVGFKGDTDANGAAGNFTKWANHMYGFVGREVGGQTAAQAGISITGCSFLVTDAGKALNGGASWWHTINNESECYIGSSTEEADF